MRLSRQIGILSEIHYKKKTLQKLITFMIMFIVSFFLQCIFDEAHFIPASLWNSKRAKQNKKAYMNDPTK